MFDFIYNQLLDKSINKDDLDLNDWIKTIGRFFNVVVGNQDRFESRGCEAAKNETQARLPRLIRNLNGSTHTHTTDLN